MQADAKTRRYHTRQPSTLKATVRCWVDPESEHVEETSLIDLSRSGARLTLGHEIEIGQPVQLSFAMNRLLRAFDKNEPLYTVWGVVRSITCLMSNASGMIRYEIGVAFIGPDSPDGYLEAPEKRYELKPTPSSQGFWQVRELKGRWVF